MSDLGWWSLRTWLPAVPSSSWGNPELCSGRDRPIAVGPQLWEPGRAVAAPDSPHPVHLCPSDLGIFSICTVGALRVGAMMSILSALLSLVQLWRGERAVGEEGKAHTPLFKVNLRLRKLGDRALMGRESAQMSRCKSLTRNCLPGLSLDQRTCMQIGKPSPGSMSHLLL